jgi:predicted metal-binding membrane protein
MTEDSALEAVLKRDRWIVAAGLAAVTLLAWIDLARMAIAMRPIYMSMSDMVDMAGMHPWTWVDFALMFWMWVVMMVAMMLPSAAPMMLLHARVCRTSVTNAHALAPTVVFAGGYLVAWVAFSVVATSLQWGLERGALLSATMVSTSPLLGGFLLLVAGIYQWTPYKQACLRYCRSPVQFIAAHWRRGTVGAFRMGLEHGAFCVGCCWALMGLLFFGGVMNLLWIAVIAFFVLLEKVVPRGAQGGRLTGALMVAVGALVVLLA